MLHSMLCHMQLAVLELLDVRDHDKTSLIKSQTDSAGKTSAEMGIYYGVPDCGLTLTA